MSTSTPITSSDNSHYLHHTFFEPKDDIKATLLIVHGMAEHS
ncbi:alpha/beta hydrolase, partial [Psychrobacter sp. 1U2]